MIYPFPDVQEFVAECRENPAKFEELREAVLLMEPITARDSGHICAVDRDNLSLQMMRDEIKEMDR